MTNREIAPECEELHNNKSIIKKAKDKMPKEELLYDIAELFKVFSDSTRIKILYALENSPMCVCDIAEVLNMTHSAVSHQLRILKQSRLVDFDKKGKWVIYSLADSHISTMLDQGMEHISE